MFLSVLRVYAVFKSVYELKFRVSDIPAILVEFKLTRYLKVYEDWEVFIFKKRQVYINLALIVCLKRLSKYSIFILVLINCAWVYLKHDFVKWMLQNKRPFGIHLYPLKIHAKVNLNLFTTKVFIPYNRKGIITRILRC